MPSSPQARTMARTLSAPARWPSMRGNRRCCAHRPLPSMMMATWRGMVLECGDLSPLCRWSFMAESADKSAHSKSQKYRLLSSSPDAHDAEFRAAELRELQQVQPRALRQVIELLTMFCRSHPAIELLIHRHAAPQLVDVTRD